MHSVFKIADRIAMIHEGRVIEIGTSEEIKNSQNPFVHQFINGNPDGPINLFEEQGEPEQEAVL